MIKFRLLCGLSALALCACSTIDTQAEYSSGTPRSSTSLSVPPGMTSPDLNGGYKMATVAQAQSGYKLDKVRDMKIMQGGSEFWLVVNNKSVNQVFPMVIAFLNQLGIAVKYQNNSVGIIQTDWATRNNTVNEGSSSGMRELFAWAGWSSMYSLNSQYMYRVSLWQNESNTVMLVTDYQMNEVYPGCVPAINSTNETSDKAITKWMPVPPDPRMELDFLTRFMAFAGLNPEEVKQIVAVAESQAPQAVLSGNQLIIKDQFDRAWWRTGLALERVSLGVVDKNRSAGIYDVYPLQAQVENNDPGFISRWFGNDASDLAIPGAKYTVQLTPQGNDTVLTLKQYPPIDPKENFAQIEQQYLKDLLKQLQ